MIHLLPHRFQSSTAFFSVVHYNVQSVQHSLRETWLNESIINQDLMLNNFQVPFRRDRIGNSHGGMFVYVKDGIPCKRRTDLELIKIECV